MHGNIYQVVPFITKEEILEICDYKDIPNYGTVMEYQEFIKNVDAYSIIDCDGSGKLVLNDKVVKNSSVWIFGKTIFFPNKFFIPFHIMNELFGEDMKIIWFNK